MPAINGALAHANSDACNSIAGIHPQAPSTLCTASRHGTVNAYKNHRCRCPVAVRAWSRYMKDYRLRRLRGVRNLVDATGTRRRIHALHAIGWRSTDLGELLDCTATAVHLLTKRDRVHRTTAAKLRRIYDQLSGTRGPSPTTARFAARRNWLPPLWWDDDTLDDPAHDPTLLLELLPDAFIKDKPNEIIDKIAVDRFAGGDDTVSLNRAEKRCAYTEMLRRGASRNETVRRLRISWTTARQFAESLPSAPVLVGVAADAGCMSEAAS